MAGPFYFDWCDEGTPWGSGRLVEDEQIESFELNHVENDFATLRIRIKNPHIGPLHVSRKTWCWFSLNIGTTASQNVVPLFFGQLMAMPTDIAGDAVEFTFRAMPPNIAEKKAAVADSLRALPFYDELFVDLSGRDDPDKVLEGYASLWHCNRTTHALTISSVTQGEDGTEVFTADEVPSDSVKSDLSQTPLTMVGVDATVKWRQVTSGIVDLGAQMIMSYTGSSMVTGWPSPGQGLGGGYTAISSLAVDGAGDMQSYSYSYHWQSTRKTHRNGDTMSHTHTKSGVLASAATITGNVSVEKRNGFLDPYAKDSDGDPAPLNISPYYKATSITIASSSVRAGLILQYETDRAYSERVMFTVSADLQPMIGDATDPHAGEEAIIMSDADAGSPIVRLRSWYNVRSQPVALGEIVFPEYPGFPGLKIGQIVVLAGTTGADIPAFSPILGDITVDGSAHWASLGPVDPGTSATSWPKHSDVVAGTIILPDIPGVVLRYRDLVMPGAVNWPVSGVAVSIGEVIIGNNGSYHICTTAGTTAVRAESVGYGGLSIDSTQFTAALYTIPVNEPAWPTTWGSVTFDGTVHWFGLGMTSPDGSTYYICTQAGTTGDVMPPFDSTVGAITNDGTAKWTAIARAQIPVGGVTGDVRASSYFPTDRGNASLEYLICLARAKLLYAARAVKITFDCKIERAVALSCRKNALLQTLQLPGGQAFGKIIEYAIRGGGDGVMSGTVTIGCTIGKGNTVALSAGTPTYVQSGYVSNGYQQMEGKTVALPTVGDVGYSPPLDRRTDDGLVFPLTRAQIVLDEVVHGDLVTQENEARDIIAEAQQTARVNSGGTPTNEEDAILRANELSALSGSSGIQSPIAYEIHLKRLTDVSFASLYSIRTQPLVAPKHINLEAAT